MKPIINLRQIEAFRAVMLTGSVVGAAKFMNVTQPGVSRTIGLLELHLGYALFERRGRRLIPTHEAESLSVSVTSLKIFAFNARGHCALQRCRLSPTGWFLKPSLVFSRYAQTCVSLFKACPLARSGNWSPRDNLTWVWLSSRWSNRPYRLSPSPPYKQWRLSPLVTRWPAVRLFP